MVNIGFIGAGNMGLPMLTNLVEAGHIVTAFDLSKGALNAASLAGAKIGSSLESAVTGNDVIITMLPAGKQVKAAYLGESGVISMADSNAILIDCSTIDVTTAREVCDKASQRGLDMIDAPVSGGVAGAAAGTLTFMVGGTQEAFDRAKSMLDPMAKTVVYAGPSGNGQAAKICNNMMLAAGMIVTSEAFCLADKLGLDRTTMFEIVSQATGQCWALTNYCPAPGPLPSSPANNGYKPGFTAAMMDKDLKLANNVAKETGANTPIGAVAAELYDNFCSDGNGDLDFSAIFLKIIQEEK